MHQDPQGVMWFVTFRGDIKRYDGQEVQTVHVGDGARSHVHKDVAALATHFLRFKAAHVAKRITGISAGALSLLQAHTWPGNVRELEQTIERAVTLCQGEVLQAEDLRLSSPAAAAPASPSHNGHFLLLEEVERQHIQAVLERTGWVIRGERGAAALLDLPESSLRDRMKKLGIVRPGKEKGG